MEIKRGFIKRVIPPHTENLIASMWFTGAFTQKEIGQRFGITQGYVSKIVAKVTREKTV